jgi:hypothetical protein
MDVGQELSATKVEIAGFARSSHVERGRAGPNGRFLPEIG